MGGVTVPTIELAVLPGDGVGPEVTTAALAVLRAAVDPAGLSLAAREYPIGWAAVQTTGSPFPDETREACLRVPAVFLGAVGHPDADREPKERRPETGLLALRKSLGCWANLRPTRVTEALVSASPLRPERVAGTDLLIVRELGGGLYYGEPRSEHADRGTNTMTYSADEVRRIARMAFELAAGRRGDLTSIDKANVLETSRLWRRIVDEVAEEWPEVSVRHLLVDRAAMDLVLEPTVFDVMLTENLFGDILSDQASGIAGSLGTAGSASLGGTTDLYEPVHGSAPTIAGKGVANPAGAIASMALMLRITFGLTELADRIDAALDRTFGEGVRTLDLCGPEEASVGTAAFTERVIANLEVGR